jgi:hypothetical protein
MHAHHYLGEANTDTLLYKLWQKLHDTPECAAHPASTHSNLMQSPLLTPNSVTDFGPCPNVIYKEQEQVLKYRTDMIHTEKHTKRLSHTTGPATCLLCRGSDSAPHILLSCNNHTLKRMHINRHHHAVRLCGEEINKGKQGSEIVTVDACNSEKPSDLTMTSKETFLTGFFHYKKTFQLDIKAVQMACYLCPLREEAGIWIPNRFPLGTETYIL